MSLRRVRDQTFEQLAPHWTVTVAIELDVPFNVVNEITQGIVAVTVAIERLVKPAEHLRDDVFAAAREEWRGGHCTVSTVAACCQFLIRIVADEMSRCSFQRIRRLEYRGNVLRLQSLPGISDLSPHLGGQCRGQEVQTAFRGSA